MPCIQCSVKERMEMGEISLHHVPSAYLGCSAIEMTMAPTRFMLGFECAMPREEHVVANRAAEELAETRAHLEKRVNDLGQFATIVQ